MDLKLANLEKKETQLVPRAGKLETKNLYLEAYSRRENIQFENIMEETNHSRDPEDTEHVLCSFLESELGYKDARSVEIQRVHRVGMRNGDKPRVIIARFLRYKNCENILSLGHRLKGTAHKMYQDLPYGIVERRRAQMETFLGARRNKIPAAFSKSQPDKLHIRGKLWPIGEPLNLLL